PFCNSFRVSNVPDIHRLWSRFLAGEKLSAQEQRRLVDALDTDPELRESLLENLQLHNMLEERIDAEREAERFVADLVRRLNPPTSRILRRRRVAPASGEAAWRAAHIAA